jgi:dephospho-CoA kinase
MTTDHKNIQILAFVGLPGAGKSEAVDYVCQKNIPKVYFGGIIYDAMREEGVDITPESQQKFREEIREREGKDFVVKRAVRQARDLIEAGQRRIVFDGVYSWTEYKILKHEFPGELMVVAVVAPRRVRHHRLANRPDRPFTGEEATARDWAEIENLEKGGPIAIADHYIHNDGSLDKLHAQIDTILDETKFTQR